MNCQDQKTNRNAQRETVAPGKLAQENEQQSDNHSMQQNIAEMIAHGISKTEDPALDGPRHIANQQRFLARKTSDKNGLQIAGESGLTIQFRMVLEDSDVVVINVSEPDRRQKDCPGRDREQ